MDHLVRQYRAINNKQLWIANASPRYLKQLLPNLKLNEKDNVRLHIISSNRVDLAQTIPLNKWKLRNLNYAISNGSDLIVEYLILNCKFDSRPGDQYIVNCILKSGVNDKYVKTIRLLNSHGILDSKTSPAINNVIIESEKLIIQRILWITE